jgi:hypothetical protein
MTTLARKLRTSDLEHLVALVHDEVLHLVHLEVAILDQAENAAWCTNDDVLRPNTSHT